MTLLVRSVVFIRRHNSSRLCVQLRSVATLPAARKKKQAVSAQSMARSARAKFKLAPKLVLGVDRGHVTALRHGRSGDACPSEKVNP